MPNPKRRHSKTRTAKRRTHDSLTAATTGLCPQCQEPKAPHRICPHCGYYNAATGQSRRRRIGRRSSCQIRIAVDAMGGDHAPSVVVDGAVAAARHLDAGIDLGRARTADVERALERAPDWRDARDRDRRGPGRHRDGGVSVVRHAAQAAFIGESGGRARGRAQGGGARERWHIPAQRCSRRTPRSAWCRASIVRRWRRRSRPGVVPRCCSTWAQPWSAGRSTCCNLR